MYGFLPVTGTEWTATTVQPRTLHCAAKYVRTCRGWDTSSHAKVVGICVGIAASSKEWNAYFDEIDVQNVGYMLYCTIG